MVVLDAVGHTLQLAFAMTWEITWALILGFWLSAAVQAVVPRSTISGLLGDDRPKTLAIATGLGRLRRRAPMRRWRWPGRCFARALTSPRRWSSKSPPPTWSSSWGSSWPLLGWQFTAAEFVGGPIMIVVLALLFRVFLRPGLLAATRRQADRGLAGSMEGHAAMDMSVSDAGSLWRRLTSGSGFAAVSHIFVMEWAAVLRDVVAGLLLAGAIGAWVPQRFWQSFFLVDYPLLAKLWGPLVGPLVAVASFVCSIGNVPLAAVLWKGGISFGGVASFVFADLLIIPILLIYWKYYGGTMTGFLLATFYAATVTAGYLVEIIFGIAGLVPAGRHAHAEMAQVSWNYTTFLNIAFLVGAAVLVVRFVRTGGTGMLTRMGGGPDDIAGHPHDGHGQGGHDAMGSTPDDRAGHLATGASHDHRPRR